MIGNELKQVGYLREVRQFGDAQQIAYHRVHYPEDTGEVGEENRDGSEAAQSICEYDSVAHESLGYPLG